MERNIIINLLADNIRLERLKNRLTQDKLAELSGLSTKYINSIEAKKVNPSIVAVVNICQALNIDLNKLINL
ncbi:helix-turn-helix transcriptional regulator [bacterium]|nr:helix-turn-helix transcriptional regulator [bacterium]